MTVPNSGYGYITDTTPVKKSQIVGWFFYTGQISANTGLQFTVAYFGENAGGELDVWYYRPYTSTGTQLVTLYINYVDEDIQTS